MGAQAASPSSVAGAKIADLATDKHPVIRAAALRSLGMMGDEAVNYLDIILKRLNDIVWSVRAAALVAITGCGVLGQMYANEVCQLLFDPEINVRITALESLVKMGDRGAGFAE